MSFPRAFYRWRPHPWHGLEVGNNPPRYVNAYIEITPFDHIKYEVDKTTGYLRVDRPQRSSSLPPTLYGFIPRTFCGHRVGTLSDKVDEADGDPLDICVVTERPIDRTEVILNTRVIGGLQMIDDAKADDKIIDVLDNDTFWESTEDIAQLPEVLIERLRHYFATYKLIPGKPPKASVESVYSRDHALRVIEAAMKDYDDEHGG